MIYQEEIEKKELGDYGYNRDKEKGKEAIGFVLFTSISEVNFRYMFHSIFWDNMTNIIFVYSHSN